MSKKIYVSAYNIHQGGGRVVLEAFLKEKQAQHNFLTCFIDERLELDFNKYPSVSFEKVKPSITERISAELHFRKISQQADTFYFLGNLPPIFKLNCKVILFLQNRLLVDKPFINTLSPRTIIRSILELLWFNAFFNNANTIEVQTSSMHNAVKRKYPFSKVEIHSYVDLQILEEFKKKFTNEGLAKESNSFVYIASQDPHKNLRRLILAFARIKTKKNYNLYINLSQDSKYVALAKNLNVRLKCINSSDREQLLKYIYISEYLIYPSLTESLGMPLIEAKNLNTKILASNLDFVYDSCDPISTFDPKKIDSIEKTLKEILN